MSDPSVNNDKEAEMVNKEEGFDNDSKQDTLFCQCPTKRSLCKVKKKLIKKCCIDISSYIPSKLHQFWPTFSYLTSFEEEDMHNNVAIDLVGRRS